MGPHNCRLLEGALPRVQNTRSPHMLEKRRRVSSSTLRRLAASGAKRAHTAYESAKGGLLALTRSLAADLRPARSASMRSCARRSRMTPALQLLDPELIREKHRVKIPLKASCHYRRRSPNVSPVLGRQTRPRSAPAPAWSLTVADRRYCCRITVGPVSLSLGILFAHTGEQIHQRRDLDDKVATRCNRTVKSIRPR